MKKLILILAVMVVAFASCEQNNNQPKAQPQSGFASSYDFFYLQEGHLYFYNLQTHEATLFEGESDFVQDALCSKNNVVYYNVIIDDALVLKRLDLNAADPQPEKLVDWDVLVEEDEWSGMPSFGEMFFDYHESQIGLERDLHWFAGKCNNLAVYDLSTGKVNKYELYHTVDLGDDTFTVEDLPDESGFDRWGSNASPKAEKTLFEIGDYVYYVGNGQKVCLNDQIDLEESFSFGLDDGYDQMVIGEDPTGKKALIAMYTAIGDGEVGIYVVSTLDGKEQMELPGSAYTEDWPEWLPDGSLLYVGYIDGEGLFLLEPDNNIRFIAESSIFCALHK